MGTLAAGPALAHLVMGVSSGKFSVTRLTVTTVLTTTEVITAPSAERLYKTRCPQDNDKNTVLWRCKRILQEFSRILTRALPALPYEGLEQGRLRGVKYFTCRRISKRDFKPRAVSPPELLPNPGHHRGACSEECLVNQDNE